MRQSLESSGSPICNVFRFDRILAGGEVVYCFLAVVEPLHRGSAARHVDNPLRNEPIDIRVDNHHAVRDVVTLSIGVRLAHDSHYVDGGAGLVLGRGDTIVHTALHEGGHVTLLRKVEQAGLRLQEVTVLNPEETHSWAAVAVVSLHPVTITGLVHATHIVQDSLPLATKSHVAGHLTQVVHVALHGGAGLEHDGFQASWLRTVLHETLLVDLFGPDIAVPAVVHGPNLLLKFFLNRTILRADMAHIVLRLVCIVLLGEVLKKVALRVVVCLKILIQLEE